MNMVLIKNKACIGSCVCVKVRVGEVRCVNLWRTKILSSSDIMGEGKQLFAYKRVELPVALSSNLDAKPTHSH